MLGSTWKPTMIVGALDSDPASPNQWFVRGLNEKDEHRQVHPVVVAMNVNLEDLPGDGGIVVRVGSARGYSELPELRMFQDLCEVPLSLRGTSWQVNGSGLSVSSCERLLFLPNGEVRAHVRRGRLAQAGIEV